MEIIDVLIPKKNCLAKVYLLELCIHRAIILFLT